MSTPIIHHTSHGYQWRFKHYGYTHKGTHYTDPLKASASLSRKLTKMNITRADIKPVPVTRFD